MKHICITGAAGYIGSHLTKHLADQGNIVHAFVRAGRREAHLEYPGVEIFEGDLLDRDALFEAMDACEEVYHLAAFIGAWHKDPFMFDRVNVTGTKNVLETARKARVRKMVFTSTAAVFGASHGQTMISEEMQATYPITRYAKSKRKAEILIAKYNTNPCEVVIVNPSRVYGPDIRHCVTVVNGMIRRYMHGRLCMLPGTGDTIANWAYIDDVVRGHINAMRLGKPGHRYILGGHNLSNNAFFKSISDTSGRNGRLVRVPQRLLYIYARARVLCARLGIASPRVTPDVVRKLLADCRLDCTKATTDLDYSITPLATGIGKTVHWLTKISTHENGSNIPECPQ